MNCDGNYLTYTEYRMLGGTLEITPFNILEFEARQKIDKYTFGRLKELETQNNEVKMCVYKLIQELNSYEAETVKSNIASENTDGYSVSYVTPSTSIIEAKKLTIKDIIKDYLIDCKLEDGTPYLYCGVK